MILTKPKLHILSIFQFAFSGLGMLTLWGMALINVFSGIAQLVNGSQPADTGTVLLVAIDFGVLGLLVFASTFFSFMRLINHPVLINHRVFPRGFLGIIFIWPLILWLGSVILQNRGWTIYLFPFVQVLTVLMLVLWFYMVASTGLQKMSPQRNWGLLSAGMMGGTFLSMVAEIIGVILLLAGFTLLVFFSPSLQDEISRLAERISTVGNDIDALMRLLTPYLSRPAVIITLIFSASIAVPLVEEAFKPIGLWFLARKNLTPSEGFIGGVLSGAGFAIVESLFNTTRLLDDTWLMVSSLRFGATLMHMLASGIVGWGLASAWTQRKYLKLAGAYVIAVLLHGVWNGLAILLATSQIASGQSSNILSGSGKFTVGGLVLWSLLQLVFLLVINSRLRKKAPITAEV
jgi:hypothetical protein